MGVAFLRAAWCLIIDFILHACGPPLWWFEFVWLGLLWFDFCDCFYWNLIFVIMFY